MTTMKTKKVKRKTPARKMARSAIRTQLGRILERQREHEKYDDARFGGLESTLKSQPTLADLNSLENKIPTKEHIANLATKDDIKEIVKIYDNMKLAGNIISGSGKWSYKALLILAGIIAAWVVIFGGAKAALAWGIAALMPR